METVADVEALTFPADAPLAFLTQTTLSVDDTAAVVAALRARYPQLFLVGFAAETERLHEHARDKPECKKTASHFQFSILAMAKATKAITST